MIHSDWWKTSSKARKLGNAQARFVRFQGRFDSSKSFVWVYGSDIMIYRSNFYGYYGNCGYYGYYG